MKAIILAGGRGKRLRPITDYIPKPLIPINNIPIIEWQIKYLKKFDISEVIICSGYKTEMIESYLKKKKLGIKINFSIENKPLGTGGAIKKAGKKIKDNSFLVINGDILTRVDFRAMLDFHVEHKAEMSVAVRRHETQIPYGVIETEDERITQVLEKPIVNHFINAGIYLLNPAVFKLIPENDSYDMPELINRLINDGRTVISFPVREYWLDIGQHKDYMRAEEDVRKGKA